MSFFNWFSGKSQPRAGSNAERKRAEAGRDKSGDGMPARLAHDAMRSENRTESGKLKRHARRDQLYVAIREAMTRAGVLSSGYKFKVLSLDPRGNEFMVMVDLARGFTHPEQFGEIETQIIQHAKARFEITVPAVYWRMDEIAAVRKPKPGTPPVGKSAVESASPAPATPRYEPIQADEVAAFKQALLAASAQGPLPGAAGAAAHGAKTRQGPHSYTLLTGFEDTEMAESPTMPALSTTQYGDLN